MDKFFTGLRKLESALLICLMGAFTIVGFMQVVFRVFLRSPLAWSQEACVILFIWCMFLGAVMVADKHQHFRVDFFVNSFPRKLQIVMKYFGWTMIAVFSLILIVHGYRFMMVSTVRVTPALNIPQMYVYTILPLNGILVILHLFEHIVNDFRGKKEVSA